MTDTLPTISNDAVETLADEKDILFRCPDHVYFPIPAISNSMLKDFAKCPTYYYRKHIIHEIEDKDSKEKIRGRAVSCLLCEGEEAFKERFVSRPRHINRRTKDGRAEYAEWEADNIRLHRTEIPDDVHDETYRIRDAFFENEEAAEIFSSGFGETAWTTDELPQFGFPLKCKTDWINFDGERPGVTDIKVIKSFDEEDYGNDERQFLKFKHYRQAAFYWGVLRTIVGKGASQCFNFIFCEYTEPFRVRVRPCGPVSIGIGWEEVNSDLFRLAQCIEMEKWEDPNRAAREIELPDWYIRRREAQR